MRKLLHAMHVQPRNGRPDRARSLPTHHGAGQHVHVGVLLVSILEGKPDHIDSHETRTLQHHPEGSAMIFQQKFAKKACNPCQRCGIHNQVDTTSGRLAQLVEHLLDVQEVTGSSPVPSTIQFVLEPNSLRERVRVRFLFIGGSAEGLLGALNEQRQGITMTVVSCLLLCGIKFALCELDRHLYGALRAIAAYVRTGSLYTSGKV